MPVPVVAYTDGACSGNPGPGGWAWAVAPDGTPCAAGGEALTTNQRMEITAALEAVRALAPIGPVVVVSDSTYVVNCFRDRWYLKWEANGWRNAKKQPVANAELWRPLVELVTAGDVTFRWVKGHSGDRLNDLVDQLAVAAIPALSRPCATMSHMETIGVRELRRDASRWLARARAGEVITITDRGRPVAQLGPLPEPTGYDALVAAGKVRQGSCRTTAEVLALLAGMPAVEPGGTSLSDALDELRRDERY